MAIYKPETIPEFKLEEENIPGLTEDKIDGVINIRGFDFGNQFVVYEEITSSSDLTITCGFKPKFIHIQAMYPNIIEPDYSETQSAEIDGVWKTMGMTKQTTRFNEVALGDSSSTKAVDLQDGGNECYAYITDVTDTGFTLGTITYNSQAAGLHISILG